MLDMDFTMPGTDGIVRTVILLTVCLPVVSASGSDDTAIIVTSVIAGVLLLVLFAGLVAFCYFKTGLFGTKEKGREKRHRVKKPHMMNGRYPGPVYAPYDTGYMPPPPHPLVHHVPYIPPKYEPMQQNGYAHPSIHMPHGTTRGPRVVYPHKTYHGPPNGFQQPIQAPLKSGTINGPPPTVIKIGSVSMRPDPRPVVQVSRKKKKRDPFSKDDEPQRPKSRDRRRPPPQEFVIQPSYDGIPVIRPVIYIDDDDDDHHSQRYQKERKSRSKSRERREPRPRRRSQETSSNEPRVTEVRMETQPASSVRPPSPLVPMASQTYRVTLSRSRTPSPVPVPPVRSPDARSRASSVTEAVNALRMSVRDHGGDAMSDTTSHSSGAPSFGWTQRERAPDPAAGDVMFFPAGQTIATERNFEPKIVNKPAEEKIYGYTRVIKSEDVEEKKQSKQLRKSVTVQNEGYEVPQSLRKTIPGTRDQQPSYETEHGRTSGVYGSNIGASMSDRITAMVEDGDKSRYNHYNIGAINLGEETEEDDAEPVQMRVRRPDTPPDDDRRDSALYSEVRSSKRRPPTPPNDIPLITPRESTEIPPLNFGSMVNSPRPVTPPPDFPITPQSSFLKPRPATPPFDVETSRSNVGDSAPKLNETTRSLAADPTTGEPGSFQARQRLIEAQLKKNAGSDAPKQAPAKQPTTTTATKTPAAPKPPVPQVVVTPGVIPPPPPPPPPPPHMR